MTVETAQLESNLFHSLIAEKKIYASNGKGVYMTIEKNGKVYDGVVDAVTGAAVGALGWADPDVPGIVNEALKKHTYSFPGFICNQQAEKLAQFYIKNCPEGVFASALWTCSGSESNENALKIIRQYQKERGRPQKIKVISRENSYHGFTLGASSISDNAISEGFKDIMIDQKELCLKMPRCFPYRDMRAGETEEQYTQRLLEVLEQMIIDNDPETVSAVIVETLPGSSIGTAVPPKGYLKGLRDICNKYDVLFMLDEVMCGTGRCNPNGKLNCWENFLAPEDAPDIQTVGKTLGSGYVTIAGVLVGPKIVNAYIGGSGLVIGAQTYHSHALNCAVSLGIQEKIIREGLTANIFKNGNLMGQKLKDALLNDSNSIVGDVRGLGGFWTVQLVKNKETKESFPYDLQVASLFNDIALQNGLNIMGLTNTDLAGSWDIALYAPSFIITEDDVDTIVDRTVKSVAQLQSDLKKAGSL
ncbi:hypothetical protein HG535_0D00980 [Zygotorulaspora mrakii]|uniref:Aminotransferase n=1 Tax=Zygotorulaspora mrakii TaxID=42260 RepID=A0A7H9B187_ZYGMR|nr:uncharacterized protein HG535_0D00980 [Zygotorulaspora mrakii]QLG72390.1 hypothetical protein HG535_0D00980 [Zygotorulaspora mrakii]